MWAVVTAITLISFGAPRAYAQRPACAVTHTVGAGETLSSIAQRYLGDFGAYPRIVTATNAAAATNSNFRAITNVNVISPGQQLCIPDGASTSSQIAPTQAPAASPTPRPAAPPPATFQPTELITIYAGILRLGTDKSFDPPPDQIPQHDVAMNAFSIERFEVSNAQYASCVRAGACAPAGEPLNGDIFPAVNVTWDQANAYCTWIGRRLPNEAEWERAARGEDNWEYSWSNRPAPHFEWNAQFHGSPLSFCEVNCPVPHYIDDVNDGYATTAPVDAFGSLDPRNDVSKGFDAQNMNGNVSEWVSNWYDPTAYQQGHPIDVFGPSTSTGRKVYRGGSWATEPLRLGTRFSLPPNERRNDLGFRCAQ